MTRLNRKVEYALMALKHMSGKGPGELTTAKEVAEAYRAPFDATARVLQVMAQKGILGVEHGALGGYRIIADLHRTSLHDLISAIQGPPKIARCMHKNDQCDIQMYCNIVSPVQALNQKLADFYQSVSLAELILGWPSGAKGRVGRERVAQGGAG